MNLWVIGGVSLGLFALRFTRANILIWLAAFWIGFLVMIKWGVVPPIPASIRGMYMGVLTVALLLYAASDKARAQSSKQGMASLLLEKRWIPLLVFLLLLFPASQAWSVYEQKTAEIVPPAAGRTIHPAPPQEITVRGHKIDIMRDHNPYRELESKDKGAFSKHVENGRGVYYRNCVFCHGDDLRGDGLHGHGFDPIPANLNDPATIGMLTESYLLWRIAKGGPGLPDESTPWNSAMPAWEDKLSEGEMWDVILFLYDYTGLKPRAMEEVE